MIMVLVGGSGSGKRAVATKLTESHGYGKIHTYVTREPGEGEKTDDYFVISDREFIRRMAAKEFVAEEFVRAGWYGILKSSLKKDGKWVAVMTPEGAASVKACFPDAFIVHMKTDMKTMVLRSINREKVLDPGILDQISIKATLDHNIFSSLHLLMGMDPDLVVENGMLASLDDVAAMVAAAHGDFVERYAKSVHRILGDDDSRGENGSNDTGKTKSCERMV